MTRAGTLGAPSVRFAGRSTARSITGVDRDVAAFVGVAPRGPARLPADIAPFDADLATWMTTTPRRRSVPVAVDSWTDYRRTFGGFEGPGLLPYAVAAFFAQGGRRAHIVRLVHRYDDPTDNAAGRASATLDLTTSGPTPVPITLSAADEGTWGNRLRATLSLSARPVATLDLDDVGALIPVDEDLPVGSLVLGRAEGSAALRFVTATAVDHDPTRAISFVRARFAQPFEFTPDRLEVIHGNLHIVDADPTFSRSERHTRCGLHADHPRWLARVLLTDSDLVHPEPGWASTDVRITDPLLGSVSARFSGGADRWHDVVADDIFDRSWVPGNERPGDGLASLAEVDEVGLLMVPDLYAPSTMADPDDVADVPTTAGPLFAPCPDPGPLPAAPSLPLPGLEQLRLDPTSQLPEIIALQTKVVEFAAWRRDLTALLDVPPGLTRRRVMQWRNRFDSRHAAAYHPWLDVAAPDDGRDRLVRVPPSSFAAGVIADRERRLGVHTGPANQVIHGAARVAEVVDSRTHDEMHPEGINVFAPEWDGIRLTGARTLSRNTEWRQLSINRLLTVIRLSLLREMAWAVFEPNNEALWRDVRRTIDRFMRRLHDHGALAGSRPSDSYFVRCDTTTMTRNDLDNGRLVCLIGVAPVEPVEYIVLRLEQQGDTTARIEVTGA